MQLFIPSLLFPPWTTPSSCWRRGYAYEQCFAPRDLDRITAYTVRCCRGLTYTLSKCAGTEAPSDVFKGSTDKVSRWNREVSASRWIRVVTAQNSGSPRTQCPLVGTSSHWQLGARHWRERRQPVRDCGSSRKMSWWNVSPARSVCTRRMEYFCGEGIGSWLHAGRLNKWCRHKGQMCHAWEMHRCGKKQVSLMVLRWTWRNCYGNQSCQ